MRSRHAASPWQTGRRVKKFLLLLGVLLGALLVAEVVCRMVLEDPLEADRTNSSTWRVEGLVADPELAYSFQPGYSGRMALGDEYDLPFHINGQGLRDEVDFAPEHPGVRRILLLGDSFVFGVGVAFEDTLGEQLERALDLGEAGGLPVEVVPVGVPGYGPDDYALLAERWVPRVHPDLVLVALFTGNDIYDCDIKRSDPKVVVEGYLVSRRQAWSYNIRKYSVLANLALQSFAPGRVEQPRAKTATEVEAMCRTMGPWLSRLAAVSQDGGPPVAMLILYGKDYITNLKRSGKGYTIKGLADVLRVMRHLGMTVLDPQDVWTAEDATVERYFFPRDAHHTAAGNRMMAEWTAATLRQQFPTWATSQGAR